MAKAKLIFVHNLILLVPTFSIFLLNFSPEPNPKFNKCAAVGSKGEKVKEVRPCVMLTSDESKEKALGEPSNYIWATSHWPCQKTIMSQMMTFHSNNSKETK